jgi:DHA3 family macrolide efflux protein-like MFS transporter
MSELSTNKQMPSTGFKQLFSISNYRSLISAQLISDLGDGIYALSLIWAIKVLTGSAVQMSILLAVEVLPLILFGVFAGVVVDHVVNKKKILLWADLARGLIVSLLALLWWTDLIQPWMLIVSAFFLSCFTAFFSPARTVAIRMLVPAASIPYAQSLGQSIQTTVGLIAPAIAGILIAIDIGWAFIINALSFFLSYFFVCSIHDRKLRQPKSTRMDFSQFGRNIKEGFQAIRSMPLIRGLLIYLILLNFLFAPVSVLIPILAENPTQLATYETTFIIGALIGSIVAGYLSKYPKIVPISLGIFLTLLPFIALAFIDNWILTASLLLITGLGFPIANVTLTSLFITTVPAEILGRATGTIQMFTLSAKPLALLSTGSLLVIISLQNMFLIIAGLGLLILLLMILNPALRRAK